MSPWGSFRPCNSCYIYCSLTRTITAFLISPTRLLWPLVVFQQRTKDDLLLGGSHEVSLIDKAEAKLSWLAARIAVPHQSSVNLCERCGDSFLSLPQTIYLSPAWPLHKAYDLIQRKVIYYQFMLELR
jgi:hypothetical protein